MREQLKKLQIYLKILLNFKFFGGFSLNTKRQIILGVLNHEENIVPSWTMAFFNVPTAKRLIGKENVVTDFEPKKNYKFGSSTKENQNRNIKYAATLDDYAIGVGKGANFAFGHGGPGEIQERLIERGKDYYISEFETGVKKEVKFNPYFYHHFDYSLDNLKELENIIIPDGMNNVRFKGIDTEVDYYKKNGYFTFGNINGIFSGLHYFFYPYDKLLVDMLLNKKDLKKLISKLANFNLNVSEQLLKRGVDCITFCDDLGNKDSLLFSPVLYEELFFPYHKQLADLCHSYDAYLHMHSHGNIIKIFDLIVKAGIDMINPLDPTEGMKLEYLKKEYGDKITLVGGMNKYFFTWKKNKMKKFLENIINVGRKNGGYIMMDNGGIPEDITKDKFDFYLKISKEIRERVC